MNEQRHAENGAILALRPVADPAAIGMRASSDPNSTSLAAAETLRDPALRDREQLLSFAVLNGLIPPGAALPQSPRSTVDFRSIVARIGTLKPSVELEPLAFVEPLDRFDPALDDAQVDVVARALNTPDLLFVQGLPGAGKTRVIAEIVRHASRRGRVLLLAASGAAIDAVLARLMGTAGLTAIRLLARDERGENLPTGVAGLTAASQERAQRAEWLRLARIAEREGEERSRQLGEAATAWNFLAGLADRRQQLAEEHSLLSRRRDDNAVDVRRDAESATDTSDFVASLRHADQSHGERMAEIDAGHVELLKDRCNREADLRIARAECEDLARLQAAGSSGKFWAPSFWRAKFSALPRRMIAARERLEAAQTAVHNLLAREEKFENDRRALEGERSKERSGAIECEIARRLQDFDIALARFDQADLVDEQQFRAAIDGLPAGLMPPSERTPEAVRKARAAWDDCQRDCIQHLHFTRRWREFVENQGDVPLDQWRHMVSLVALPLAATTTKSAFLDQPFDFLIIDEAHLLAEEDVLSAAARAKRCILVGEPVAVPPLRTQTGSDPRTAAPRRSKPDYFGRLWGSLHHDRWTREGERLVYRLHPLLADQRRTLECEAVADQPEIELRILPLAGNPVLAEIAFPAKMSEAEAREYLFRELGEVPCQPRFRLGRWSANDSETILHLNPSADGSPPQRRINMENGISLLVHELNHDRDEFVFAFRFAEGWNQEKAEAWAIEHLLRNDSGRCCRLEKNYRQAPALAGWLREATMAGGRSAASHRGDAPVQFEPVPRRAPTGSRRGGAGYEIDLADPGQRELLPTELDTILPARGFVNLPEAQAIAELAPRLPRDHAIAITAPYASQVQVLKYYLPGDSRVFFPSELAQRECDLLLVSLTRSHVARAVTYGDDPATLVNSFSRPRCRLILVGDPGTLVRRAEWEGAIDHLDETAGERERRWVNALLGFLPHRGAPRARPIEVKA